MKKIYLFVLLLSVAMISKAQIISDSNGYDKDGNRVIELEQEEFDDDNTVGLTYVNYKGSIDVHKYLCFTIEDMGEYEQGRSLYIKFADNSIMQLKNLDTNSKHALAGHIGMFGPTMGWTPYYEVSDAQLDSLCNMNVTKLRFVQGDDMKDFKIKRNKVSKIISECRNNADNYATTKKDELEGF